MTLESDNVMWLKGRAGAEHESVSELLDQIVTAARQGRCSGPARSVVGTIDIDTSDPLLERADVTVRAAFDASLGRPVMVRERAKRSASRPRKGRKRARG